MLLRPAVFDLEVNVASLVRLLVSLLLFMLPCCAVAQNNALRGFADIHNHEFANEAFGGYGPEEPFISRAKCTAGLTRHCSSSAISLFANSFGGSSFCHALNSLPVCARSPSRSREISAHASLL